MGKLDWSRPVSREEMERRASGRRSYNAWRRFIRHHRRAWVAYLLWVYRWPSHGAQAKIAARLGVHPSTVTRDLAALAERDTERPCPWCGTVRDWVPPAPPPGPPPPGSSLEPAPPPW